MPFDDDGGVETLELPNGLESELELDELYELSATAADLPLWCRLGIGMESDIVAVFVDLSG